MESMTRALEIAPHGVARSVSQSTPMLAFTPGAMHRSPMTDAPGSKRTSVVARFGSVTGAPTPRPFHKHSHETPQWHWHRGRAATASIPHRSSNSRLGDYGLPAAFRPAIAFPNRLDANDEHPATALLHTLRFASTHPRNRYPSSP